MQRRCSGLDFRAADGEEEREKIITGHPAVFDCKTDIGGFFYEIVERGAFDECDLTDVCLFANHDWNKIPLARSRRNNTNSTMQLSVDEKGLYMRARLDVENNPEARQLYSSVERGDMDGMSYAFRVKEDAWEDMDGDMPTRRIKKVARVYEVSAVNEPAYTQTDLYARDRNALENARSALESAKGELEIYRLKTKILGGV